MGRDAETGRKAEPVSNVGGRALARDPNLLTIFAVTLIAIMGVGSLTPAFPKISRELGISSREVGLLISFFTVPGVVLAPVLGLLADRLGKKQVLVPSMLLFALAGGSCALARDFEVLLGLRLLQGIGASAISALNMAILSDLFSGPERTTAMGYNSSVLSVGAAAYPAIGGVLAGAAWFLPFLLPLLALPVAGLVIVRLEARGPTPGLDLAVHLRGTLRAARDRRVIVAMAASAVTFIVLFGPYLAFVPILMDERFGTSAPRIGLLLSLGSLASALSAARLGRVAGWVSGPRLVTLGYVAYAGIMLCIPLMKSAWGLAVPVVAFGATNGLAIPSLINWLMGVAPEEQRGAILALNGSVLRLGQTLGPLLAAALLTVGGLDAVFWGAAGLAALMAAYAALAMHS